MSQISEMRVCRMLLLQPPAQKPLFTSCKNSTISLYNTVPFSYTFSYVPISIRTHFILRCHPTNLLFNTLVLSVGPTYVHAQTPMNTIFLDNLTMTQIFPTLYGIRWFTTVLQSLANGSYRKAHYSSPPPHAKLTNQFNIILSSTLRQFTLPNFLPVFQPQLCTHSLSHACHLPRLSHP